MTRAIVKKTDLRAALQAVEGRSLRTTATYRAAMKAFTASGHPLTVDGFAVYIGELRATRSASTVNLALAAGRKAFVTAGERLGLPAKELSIIKGALAEIHAVRIAPPEVSTVTPEERVRLLAALPLRVRLIAETLYMTGARVSEIIGIRPEAVKINGVVELRLRGKGDKERTAKITADLYRRILAAFPSGKYLFTTRQGNPFTRQYVSREIERAALRELGRGVTAHVLRHSRATDLIERTGKIKGVSRLLGHASEASTLRYYVKQSLTDEELFNGTTP